MKKLKVIFIRCLLYLFLACTVTSITGCFIFDECFAATDCGNPDDNLPTYANKSGEMVRIFSIGAFYTPDKTRYGYEKFIADGDTLHYTEEEWRVPMSNPANIACGGLVLEEDCNKPIRMDVHFLGEPQKCLVFDGPIKNDGIDMRSWDSYKKGNKIPNWADFWAGVEYVYTITPEHRDMGKEEDCPKLLHHKDMLANTQESKSAFTILNKTDP